MDSAEKEVVLNRIMSNFDICIIDNKLYKVLRPTTELKYQADKIYEDTIYDLSFEGWLRKDDIERVLIQYSLWSKDHSERLDSLEKQVDAIKVDMFKSFLNDAKIRELRKSLTRMKNSIESLMEKKTCLDSLTLESYANNLKLQYVIALSIIDEDNNFVYTRDSFWFADPRILLKVIEHLKLIHVSHEVLRELARTDPWRTYWNISKSKVFSGSSLNWSNEQRILVLYSKMYDNAYGHPECPAEKVIADDDMFDGWLILEKKKHEKAIMDKQINTMVGKKQAGAGEIFIPAASQEHAMEIAKHVNELNDFEAKMKLKQREAALKQQGRIAEEKLPDIQVELKQQANKEFQQKFKRK
jgi:hypothetical protein